MEPMTSNMIYADDSINNANFRAILRNKGKQDTFLKLNLENDQRSKYNG